MKGKFENLVGGPNGQFCFSVLYGEVPLAFLYPDF